MTRYLWMAPFAAFIAVIVGAWLFVLLDQLVTRHIASHVRRALDEPTSFDEWVDQAMTAIGVPQPRRSVDEAERAE